MTLDKAFLTSKVAQRIFLLFLLCALLPLVILAVLTSGAVDSQLSEQAIKRLNQNCKVKGLEIYNNLRALETELRMFASSVSGEGGVQYRPSQYGSTKGLNGSGFRKLTVLNEEFKKAYLSDGFPEGFKITPEELDHMKTGRCLMVVRQTAKTPPRIFMAGLISAGQAQETLVIGEVEPKFVWGMESEDDLLADMPMLVLGPKREVLLSLPRDHPIDREIVKAVSESGGAGTLQYNFKGETYLTGYWRLFLKYHFFIPGWTIVMSQARSTVLAPVAYFKKFFLLFALLTFLVVCLLSVALIRKSLIPIETLRKGTEQIANGEFGIEVDIRSGDEFESLGRDFNEMSRKLKEGRAMLVQSAKMGAVGQMASGVVHEIGQPLTSISGLIDILGLDKPTDAGKRRLDLMKKEMERLTGIISRFKNFARVSEQTMKPLSLNEVVEATYALLEHQIQMKRLYCNVEKQETLPSIVGDRNSLQQVLINLVINAMDALEGKKDEKPVVTVRTYSEDGKVCVEVRDNGSGIPKEIQEKIFDPFFTTKGPEKGTGLGLAIISSILHQHHAGISLESEVGKGTQFKVSFPAAT
ncbi:MAG: ATP-binding protein [Desulfobacterota bacterium]|jgi:signal transduction histidine kinase|nr:ATP-binding protein [Thermodesulfobacteriota bacterium]